MSQVDNNSDVKAAPVSNLQISQLEVLEGSLHGKLQQRKQSLAKTGIVSDIQLAADSEVQTIQQALTKVREARAQVDPRVTNHLARAGQLSNPVKKDDVEVNVDSVNQLEAAAIKAIKSVAGAKLAKGEQFASLSGRKPSYNDYMKQNIQGLFELTALKG